MKDTISYKTKGTCSRRIHVTVEDDIIESVSFDGGCQGNTTGVAALVAGMSIDEAVKKLKGIKCGFKKTSCPDQLALALEELKTRNAESDNSCDEKANVANTDNLSIDNISTDGTSTNCINVDVVGQTESK